MMKIKKFIQNNFMAVVALAIAGASLTVMSFRDGGNNAKNGNGDIPLYWHEVLPNGTLGPVQNQNPNIPQTKNESVLGGAKEITSCDDSSSDACMRGFSSPQATGSPAGPNLGADYQINKN